MILKNFIIIFLGLYVCACDSSINQLLVTQGQRDSLQQKRMEARYEYNKGNFDAALDSAYPHVVSVQTMKRPTY